MQVQIVQRMLIESEENVITVIQQAGVTLKK